MKALDARCTRVNVKVIQLFIKNYFQNMRMPANYNTWLVLNDLLFYLSGILTGVTCNMGDKYFYILTHEHSCFGICKPQFPAIYIAPYTFHGF